MSAFLPAVLISSNVAVVAAAAMVIVAVALKPSKLDAIPTFGTNGWIGSLFPGLTYLSDGTDVIQKGYEKHKEAPFKVPAFYRWLVIVSSREHVEELQKAPSETLSFAADLNDRAQIEFMMGPEICCNPYHVPIMRSRLTRNLGVLHPEIRDEIAIALDDVLDLKGDAWRSVPMLGSVQQVICRTVNRVFVGLPLCRNPDWINLNIHYTFDISNGSALVRLFPKPFKPLAIWLFTNIYRSERRARELLSPVIEQRRSPSEHGPELATNPNDVLSWLMEEAESPDLTTESLTARMLFLNLTGIHTTSTSLTFALFYLATNPQYIQPLREEVESVVKKEGWSKAALAKMRKVDSFLKECQRLEGHNCVSLQRQALKDFTFSDGTFIPKGTVIATASRSAHYNEMFYKNASTFEPFRFTHTNDQEGEGARHQFVSTNVEYLPFGLGRQACPGRFFAAMVLKTMLASIVVAYDVKLEDGAARPQALRFMTANVPDPRAKVMFRRRAD